MQAPNIKTSAEPIVRRLWEVSREAPRSRCSRGPQQPAARVDLPDLPTDALEIIYELISTPSTPAACLLPLVCRAWRTAVDSAQLLVNLDVDLGPGVIEPAGVDLDAVSFLLDGPGRTSPGRAGAGTAAAAAAAVPASLLRGRQLAAWLAKYRGTVRSLRIGSLEGVSDPYAATRARAGWVADLIRIRKALTSRWPVAVAGPTLPHLVQLELPVVGLPHEKAAHTFLQVLAGCTSLQRLVLVQADRHTYLPFNFNSLCAALEPLQQLRTLHLDWPGGTGPGGTNVEGPRLAVLLKQLPPTLEVLRLGRMLPFHSSIPLSCITHLVKLRALEGVLSTSDLLVEDVKGGLQEGSSSSSSSSRPLRQRAGRTNSSSSSSAGHGAAGLTALTSMRCKDRLQGHDARLQLPSLRSLDLQCVCGGPEPAAWRQLQGMKHLRQLSISGSWSSACLVRDSDGLSGMTQVQHLQLSRYGRQPLPAPQLWAASITPLTRLVVMEVSGFVVLAGGSPLLAGLANLEQLSLDCCWRAPAELYPADAQGWEATTAGAVVQVVAAAVGAGWDPLQCLSLSVSENAEVQQVRAAACTALPGLNVLVKNG